MENLKLTQCYKCFEYLHLRPSCPHLETICSRCGGVHTHSYIECESPFSCSNCGGPHSATARVCPKYQEAFLLNEKKAYEQLKVKYPDVNSSLISNENSDFTNCLRAARLASTTPQEFSEQLFLTTQNLISPPTPLSIQMAFDNELEEELLDLPEEEKNDYQNELLAFRAKGKKEMHAILSKHVDIERLTKKHGLVYEGAPLTDTQTPVEDPPNPIVVKEVPVTSGTSTLYDKQIVPKERIIFPTICTLSMPGGDELPITLYFQYDNDNKAKMIARHCSQKYSNGKWQTAEYKKSEIIDLSFNQNAITIEFSTDQKKTIRVHEIRIYEHSGSLELNKKCDPDTAQKVLTWLQELIK